MSENDEAKLELWNELARAVMRAYVKVPSTERNADLNRELSDLIERCRRLDPKLKDFFPLD